MSLEPSRAVLITGCSSGIGRALARGLHARGYRVFATARAEEDVLALREIGLESLSLELRSSESIRSAADHVLELTGGRLYALVNNAGFGQLGAVEDLRRDVLREQFEVNVFGTQEITNRILPAMRGSGRGRIVHISSILGRVATPYRGAYCASKFALEGLTDALRMELRGSGVHVSLIEPGPIETRFARRAYRAFRDNIDCEDSFHRGGYDRIDQKSREAGRVPPFSEEPEAVLASALHALESSRPRARYTVTLPARAMAVFRRVLPDRALDQLLGGVESRWRRHAKSNAKSTDE